MSALVLPCVVACSGEHASHAADAGSPAQDAGRLDAAQSAEDAARPPDDAGRPPAMIQDGGESSDGRDAGSRQEDSAVGAPPDAAADAGAHCMGSPVGDLDCDGCVDQADHDRLLAHYGESVPPGDAASDVNDDGVVNVYDRSLLLANWGEGCPP
jgi:hypothetical protein